jgi:hypothetical protein
MEFHGLVQASIGVLYVRQSSDLTDLLRHAKLSHYRDHTIVCIKFSVKAAEFF